MRPGDSGIDQSLLSRIENRLVEVREDLIGKAVQAYDFPAAFFAQREPVFGVPVSVHPMWRRKADVSGRDLEGVVAELNLRVIHLRRLLQGAEVANTNDLPRMDIEEYGAPEHVAARLRAHWRVPPDPVRNLTTFVEKAGVMVALSPLGGTSISGGTFAVPCMAPLIVLNSEQSADRRRFTLSLELAHLIMHRLPSNTPLPDAEHGTGRQRVCCRASDADRRHSPIFRRQAH